MPPPTEPVRAFTATSTQDLAPKLCLLPDSIINDRGFNALAWSGIQSAAAQYGIQAVYIEPDGSSDLAYRQALQELLPQNCDLIVAVGFLTGDAVSSVAKENPQQKFMVLDHTLDPPLDNVWGQNLRFRPGGIHGGLSGCERQPNR